MKLKTRLMTCFVSVLMVALMLPTIVFAAGPIETERDVVLTISYKDADTAISGTVFDVYRCADVDAYGVMTATDAFSSYPVDYDGLDLESWQELATTLKGYAQRDGLAVEASGKTDINGELSLTLKPGLYLVVGSIQAVGEYTYTPSPFMVFLPGASLTENDWDYEVTSSVKYSKEYNPSASVSRKALKIWDDYGYEYARPEEIVVLLLRDGDVYDTQALNAENNWRHIWSDLSDDYEWTIVEQETDGYYVKVVQEGITFTITNQYAVPLAIENPPVAKKITGDTPDVSSPFTFVLEAGEAGYPMPDGSVGTIKETVITGAGSSEFGEIAFTKPGTYSYTISEKNTGVEGYTYDTTVYTILFTVSEQDGELVVQRTITKPDGTEVDSPVFTNSYRKPGSKLPQTGMLWWPIPLLLCCGLAFYAVGLLWRRARRDDE